MTTSLHLINEELRRRETTIADGPPRRSSNHSDSVTVYGDRACRSISIPAAQAVISEVEMVVPLIIEVEMVTMATATALPTNRS